MKRTMVKPALLLLLSTLCFVGAQGQDDDTIQFKQGMPITREDSLEYDNIHTDYPPDNFDRLTHSELPDELRETLDENEATLYPNWRNSEIYKDTNTGLYWVSFTKDSVVQRFGFDQNGNPVSVTKKDIDR